MNLEKLREPTQTEELKLREYESLLKKSAKEDNFIGKIDLFTRGLSRGIL